MTRTRRPAGRRRPGALLAVLAVAGLVTAACGLSEQSRPELLAPENVPYDLLDPNLPPSTTAPPTATSSTVEVFFVAQSDDGTRLIPTEREVRDPTSVSDRLQALLDQPPTADEVDDGITTAIPPETLLVSVEQEPGSSEVVVELSPEFFEGSEGQSQRTAFAQITCTAIEGVPGVSRVRFFSGGGPIPALVADGTAKEGAVTCRPDYLGFSLPTTTTTAPPPEPEPGELDQPDPA